MSKFVFLILLLFSNELFSQDTIVHSEDNYSIEYIDTLESYAETIVVLVHKEYLNDTLLSIEYFSEDKSYPIGEHIGYFPNGNIAFKTKLSFNGVFSELNTYKFLFYPNGNYRITGQFHHQVKYGNWNSYLPNGDLSKITQFIVPEIDTILQPLPELYFNKIVLDTMDIYNSSHLLITQPVICFGKNGLEITYKNNKPIEVRVYKFGTLILTENKKYKMRKMIKNMTIQPDVFLQ